jgi:hypothetical protein
MIYLLLIETYLFVKFYWNYVNTFSLVGIGSSAVGLTAMRFLKVVLSKTKILAERAESGKTYGGRTSERFLKKECACAPLKEQAKT